ncbi:glutathione peroxidase [Derxia lacustris]|uniref:glutathione peroxidase n=1 Tax=Derxia lacustris TaxID=764842 RepID=UPI000A1717D6|nr:glutathione peroxidase [Derxia lacustris]
MTLPSDIELRRIDGSTTTTGEFAGKVLLIVNTASRCGFTPQYAGLQALHAAYAGRGLVVMGFPCNQFGQQEPGDATAIADFCETKFSVGFPMFDKIEVNGERAHPLFRHLKSAAPGLLGSEAIKWNFTKFLVGRDGKVVSRHAPTSSPESLTQEIEALLAA